ncbi:MAG: KilA-N domain-containing protein [Lutibacter sp.]|jgi:hypothetical protein
MNQKTETPTENVVEFLYQETQIHFLVNPNEKDVMINATEMAKLFEKRTGDYLANQTTKTLINELELTLISVNSNVKIIENRGQLGMYFCPILAIDFATWLDVKFKIWVYETIISIMFSKTKSVENAVSLKQQQEAKKIALVEKATKENNKDFLDYLLVQKAIKKITSLENKAINNLKSQYKINF